MKQWIVDAGPLTPLAKHAVEHPEWECPLGVLHVAAAVKAEADTESPHAPRHQLLRRRTGGQLWIKSHDLVVGSDAERMYTSYLRPAQASADKHEGEDQSIALCRHELPSAIFVTGDARAALVALAELGLGRVATPFDLWAYLSAHGLIAAEERDKLDEATVRSKQGLFPGVPSRLR